MKNINFPLEKKEIEKLICGQAVKLSGVIYTARDQAHKKILESINSKKKLPLDLKNQIIYYCGPTRTPKGKIIGSCGPTTSSRMDRFTPLFLKAGLKGMIGKGKRSKEVLAAIKKHKAIYFLTFAGCGAFLAKYVRKVSTVAYRELGSEAILRLEVKDFPLIVGIDSKGRSIF